MKNIINRIKKWWNKQTMLLPGSIILLPKETNFVVVDGNTEK